jgi:hypothetical protein
MKSSKMTGKNSGHQKNYTSNLGENRMNQRKICQNKQTLNSNGTQNMLKRSHTHKQRADKATYENFLLQSALYFRASLNY